MPLILGGIAKNVPEFVAWRWAMFVPASMLILTGILILFFATDLPDGNYAVLKAQKSERVLEDDPKKVFWRGALNYRSAQYSSCPK
jgi:nitrate/nitrite transporter NarK